MLTQSQLERTSRLDQKPGCNENRKLLGGIVDRRLAVLKIVLVVVLVLVLEDKAEHDDENPLTCSAVVSSTNCDSPLYDSSLPPSSQCIIPALGGENRENGHGKFGSD
jgi:hypothetical protein